MSAEEAATRQSWNIQPMPGHRERIDFQRTFSEAEFARIESGHVPQEMEDKWFVFFEDGWVYLHRSWTGFCIFQVRVAKTAGGWRVEEAWVNRDGSQYQSRGTQADAELLANVLRWSLGI